MERASDYFAALNRPSDRESVRFYLFRDSVELTK